MIYIDLQWPCAIFSDLFINYITFRAIPQLPYIEFYLNIYKCSYVLLSCYQKVHNELIMFIVSVLILRKRLLIEEDCTGYRLKKKGVCECFSFNLQKYISCINLFRIELMLYLIKLWNGILIIFLSSILFDLFITFFNTKSNNMLKRLLFCCSHRKIKSKRQSLKKYFSGKNFKIYCMFMFICKSSDLFKVIKLISFSIVMFFSRIYFT